MFFLFFSHRYDFDFLLLARHSPSELGLCSCLTSFSSFAPWQCSSKLGITLGLASVCASVHGYHRYFSVKDYGKGRKWACASRSLGFLHGYFFLNSHTDNTDSTDIFFSTKTGKTLFDVWVPMEPCAKRYALVFKSKLLRLSHTSYHITVVISNIEKKQHRFAKKRF